MGRHQVCFREAGKPRRMFDSVSFLGLRSCAVLREQQVWMLLMPQLRTTLWADTFADSELALSWAHVLQSHKFYTS